MPFPRTYGISSKRPRFNTQKDLTDHRPRFKTQTDQKDLSLYSSLAAAVDDAYVPQHAFGTEEGNGAVFRHFQSAGGFVSPFGCVVNYLR